MIFLVLSGVVMTAALLVTLCRVMHWRFVLGYATLVDVVATVSLLTLYAGTFSGLFAATVAGLVLAISLSVGRKLLGYTVLKWNGSITKPAWVTTHYEGAMQQVRKQARDKAYENRDEAIRFREYVRYVVFGPAPRQSRVNERDRAQRFQSGCSYW